MTVSWAALALGSFLGGGQFNGDEGFLDFLLNENFMRLIIKSLQAANLIYSGLNFALGFVYHSWEFFGFGVFFSFFGLFACPLLLRRLK